MKRSTLIGLSLVLFGLGGSVHADEGMWTFDNLPYKHLKDKYGFTPSEEWIQRLRSSAVRFNNGGSGSFVSPNGLIMTNHHVGADTLQKISTAKKDYYKDGFLAASLADEQKAPDLELNVLTSVEDVTDRVNAAVKPGSPDAEAAVARRSAMSEIEKESTDKTGMRSDVVTLYQGGKYALYTYKKYTDVRLVMAPEFDMAFFGGDPDNFEYPRYDLDVCFFRAYEDGKPAQPKHYLKWSPKGSKEGELVFVAGHPGRTSRLFTAEHLKFLRDTSLPTTLELLFDREKFLLEYSKRGEEHARQAKEDLFSYQNSRKARVGGLGGLNDQAFMTRKQKDEQELRSRIEADPKKKALYAAAWEKIAEAQKVAGEILKPYNLIERGLAFDSELFKIARILVRLSEEQTKPNSDRLREFSDARLESLKHELFSEAPIYTDYELAKLTHSLEYWKGISGDADPLVQRVFRNRSAGEVAAEAIKGTKLADVAFRKSLLDGGKSAVQACDDPMIKLAMAVDADARAVRKEREDKVEGVETAQYAKIAKAIFEELGESVYPDATFTLRLAFGTVKGYEVDGVKVPPFTTMGGAFAHAAKHGNKPPYELPASWIQAKENGAFDLETPLNFVSTADIIGGNSGSPVVNRENEIVGLIFDGNIQSLVLDYGYEDTLARAVSVDSRAILESLRKIYKAKALAEELTGSLHINN